MTDCTKEAHRLDILHSAIAEFGKHGYAAASTNEIVKKAGVSKGLLFHHFGSKEALYTACQLYVLEQYGAYMKENKDLSGSDLFERILSNLRIKMEFGFKNPALWDFINRAWTLEDGESLMNNTEAKEYVLNAMQAQASFFFEGIDSSLFRESYDIAKIMKYTQTMLEAHWKQFSYSYQNDMDAIIGNMDTYFQEAEEIVDLFRNGAYR